MNRRRIAIPAFVVLVTVGVGVGTVVSGTSTDCLSQEFLRDHITLLDERAAPTGGAELARTVAIAEVSGVSESDEVAGMKFGLVRASVPEFAEGAEAYLVAFADSTGPRPMIGVPFGQEAPIVDSPCRVVVIDAKGRYAFTYSYFEPVDEPES